MGDFGYEMIGAESIITAMEREQLRKHQSEKEITNLIRI
jgi:hypothetical protein